MIVSWLGLAWTLALGGWLPGWLVARKLGIRHPHVAGILFSCLSTYLFLMVANAVGLPLSRMVVIGGLSLIGLAAAALTRGRCDPPAAALQARESASVSSGLRLICLAIFAVAATILAIRAIRHPLTGWDTAYRWSWLAQQLFLEGNFSFYPPVSAADFRHYVYADGIPPLTHFAQFLCFVGFGGPDPIATAPLVIGQFLLIGYLAFLMGRQLGGDRAGYLTVALIALSPLLLWSVVMGQETGWTAIGIVAMVLYLRRLEPKDWRSALAGGAAAAVAALAREYGCAMVFLALAWSWKRGADRSQLVAIVACGFVAFTWYLRNWILTGNPVFSNNIVGLFPDNAVHSAILEGYRDYLSPLVHGWVWRESATFLISGALAPVGIGVVGLAVIRRRRGLLCLTIALMIAIWWYSLGVTAGGPRYALRVLAPVVVLLAAAGAAWLARAGTAWLIGGLLILLVALAPGLASVPFYVKSYDLDAIVRAADAPRNWYGPMAKSLRHAIAERPATVLTDNAYARRWLDGTDVTAIPVWSPEAAFVFDAANSSRQISEQLREQGIRYVLKSNGGLNDAYLMTIPFFAKGLDEWQLVYQDKQNLLYRLPD